MTKALELLRPHPHRGDVVAAGTVVLTLFTAVTIARFGADWSDGARLLLALAVGLPVLAMAFQSDAGDELPRPYESVLHVCAFVLAVLILVNLADVLGAEGGSGSTTWVGLLLVAFCLYFARNRNSAIMTLLAALTGVVVLLAAVDWIFGIDSTTTVEWLLFACMLAFTVGAVHQRDARRRHAVSLVDAAGLTAIVLGVVVLVDKLVEVVASQFSGLLGGLFGAEQAAPDPGGPAGWELVLLAFGFGLIAYGCVDRERVPAFLGVGVLSVFFAHAFWPGSDGPSLIGWPIVLLLMGLALLVIGLRPRQELPPEPEVPHA